MVGIVTRIMFRMNCIDNITKSTDLSKCGANPHQIRCIVEYARQQICLISQTIIYFIDDHANQRLKIILIKIVSRLEHTIAFFCA